MSKSAIKALTAAQEIIAKAGVTVNLVGYVTDAGVRKNWRNADALAALVINSAANAFQCENSETFSDNAFDDMAEAVVRYIDANLDDWNGKSWTLKDTGAELARLAEMVERNMAYEKETFTPAQPAPFGALARQTAATYNVQMRFAAMMVHTGNYETLRRGAALIAFISDRKGEYVAAHPDKVTRGGTITDQDHFTAFILSGVWL